MRTGLRLLVCLLVGAGIAGAQPAPANSAPAMSGPEEPDYAFLAGGPYTQVRHSIQIIHSSIFSTRKFAEPGGRRTADEFLFFNRTEWGFTDRIELDIITPFSGQRERLNGGTVSSDFGLADSILGVRYRLLEEGKSPITLAMGPQLILPTGSVRRGTGNGSAGFAWDVSAAKDWGGPLFLFASYNYSVLPSANDTTPGSSREFTLHGHEWAAALGWRALERGSNSGANHDVHVFMEAGGAWGHEVEPGIATGIRQSKLSWVFSPGVRYGFLTARKTLIEIGVAAPIGLGPNGPKRGIQIQFQFERLFGLD